MKYKALLLDIDDTLYSYDRAHFFAMKSIISFFKKNFKIEKKFIISTYNEARKKVHLELGLTAASHNRLIYFQKMCEYLEINPLKYSLKIHELYWNNYLNNLKPFNGVYDLLEKYKNKICYVTDFTANIQYKKIEKLKLNIYSKKIVTSEEAGKEKPHPYIFMMALQKLNLNNYEVCMIGDNYEKDILGANDLNLNTIWFNHKKIDVYKKFDLNEVTKFKQILELV